MGILLMQAILHDRLPIAKIVNATVISLDDASKGYQDFNRGAAKKFVIDPYGIVSKKAAGGGFCSVMGQRICASPFFCSSQQAFSRPSRIRHFVVSGNLLHPQLCFADL
jgi:hypothetical protein